MVNWIKVFETKDAIEAELTKNELLNNDVSAVVLNKKDSNYTIFGYYQVMVPDIGENNAKMILENFNKNA